MNNKYYYVPVVARRIFIGEDSLKEATSIVDDALSKREDGRVCLTYDTFSEKELDLVSTKDIIAKYNLVTSNLYREKDLPERIVLVSNENGLYEISTERQLSTSDPSYLECFRVSSDKVFDIFYEKENYTDLAINFFGLYDRNKARKTYKRSNLR